VISRSHQFQAASTLIANALPFLSKSAGNMPGRLATTVVDDLGRIGISDHNIFPIAKMDVRSD